MVNVDKLSEWEDLKNQLADLSAREMELRKEIFAECFEDPAEGVNSIPLEQGFKLKGTYKLNRSIAVEALPHALEQLREMGIHSAGLVKYKPELSVTEYKGLPDDARKAFDHCLIIKPGAPTLEIVESKR